MTLIFASLAHFESGDSIAKVINPMLTAVLLTASYLFYRKLSRGRRYDPAVDKEN